MPAGNSVHDIAVLNGPNGKLHHFARSSTAAGSAVVFH